MGKSFGKLHVCGWVNQAVEQGGKKKHKVDIKLGSTFNHKGWATSE